ncbi:MAG: Rpn family recombination-promoting nuclease/putative transposase [Candidatus Cryptobacteroides sp.]
MKDLKRKTRVDEMGRRFVNLMEDAGFKAVYCDRQNKDLLIDLLNHLLPDYARVSDIVKYRDREKVADYGGAKKTILDLCCQGDGGRMFNVEVQQENSEYFYERIMYYGAGDYHSQLMESEDYDSLNPVFMVVLMSGILQHERCRESMVRPVGHPIDVDCSPQSGDLLPDEVVTRYVMKEERHNVFAPSTIFLIFAQLGRFRKALEDCVTYEDYLFHWFLNGWRYDSIPEIFRGVHGLERLTDATEVAGFTEEKYRLYKSDMKTERDIRFFARERHKEELRKMLEEERIATAKRMLADGLPIEIVSKYSGLPVEKVRSLSPDAVSAS